MGNLRFPETAFEAGAILTGRAMGEAAPCPRLFGDLRSGDSLEDERREVLDAIMSRMRGGDAGQEWEVHRRLLLHLAQAPGTAASALIQ